MGGVVGCLLVVPIAAYRGRGSGAALAPRAVAAIYKTALTTTALSGERGQRGAGLTEGGAHQQGGQVDCRPLPSRHSRLPTPSASPPAQSPWGWAAWRRWRI